ncbi:MAG TPA: PAS domain S-box protein [Noviherbaspirillum sp.]|nr:PAS domain S-box protein [Noviherbaspirillum sp.]
MNSGGRTLTLRRAIVLVVVLALLLPSLLINGYSWFTQFNDGIRTHTEELLQQHADVLATGMQEPLWNINQESANALLEAMLSRSEDVVRIEVRDNTLGVFVAGESAERRNGRTAATERPVTYRGEVIGSVRVEISNERLRKALMENLRESLGALLAQAGLSIALILILLERRLVRPLKQLSVGAERLAGRQLDVPFEWKRLDEIGMLAKRLEETRVSLRRLFAELDYKNQELEQDIDKRKRVEQELHEREERFRALVEHSPIAIIEWDSEHKVLEWNAAAERIFGHAREQAIGRHASFIFSDASRETINTRFRHLINGDGESRAVCRNRRVDGKTITCQWSHTPILDEIGGADRLLSIAEDITDQRLLEEQKAEADRALLRLAQGTSDMAGESFFELLVADLASALRTDGAFIGLRVEDWPGSVHTLAAHLRGHTVANFDYESSGTPCERALEGRICIFPSDLDASFPDAGTFAGEQWESYAGAPLRDRAGNTIGVLAVMHTEVMGNPGLVKSLLQVFSERASAELERKRAEEELRISEQRFSTIFASSPIAMFVTHVSSGYVVKDVNRAFERLFLRSRESMIGKNTIELGLYCDNADRASLIEELKRTGSTESHREVWMWRGDDSKVLIQFSGHTFTLAGERFGILACDDVTDKRRIENEIRELNANLEQRVVQRTEELQHANAELAYTLETLDMAQEELLRSEKLAALGSLVAGIAHELNTPIGNSLMVASTITDQTQALSHDFRNAGLKRSTLENYIDDAEKAGDILVRNLQRAADLVNSFKQVAVDQTSSQRRAFSVAEAVSEIMLTLWPTLKKTAFVVKQDIPDSIVMDSYPGPLGQVIANLVNNALLHGFEGRQSGTVTISAEAGDTGWMELTVRDDGVGIPAANLNRIFDPFFTTKLGAGGSGLGLNIAHNIVKGILGGRMRVQSEPGAGSTFILSLPLVAPHRQVEEIDIPARATST